MEIKVNGEVREVAVGLTIECLLAELEIENRCVAIEHNGQFLEGDQVSTVALSEGDQLEIVRFVGGG
jgi:sulfur carrier protein